MQVRFDFFKKSFSFMCCSVLLGVSAAYSQTTIEPLDTLPLGLGGMDYLVDLSWVANATNERLSFPAEYVKIRNIPFRLTQPEKGGHLFLKDIGWSDWKSDPGSFTAAYDSRPTKHDPYRAMVEIPVDDYSEAYLLAVADDDEALSNLMTLRIGILGGSKQVTLEDFEVKIPRAAETQGLGVLQVIPLNDTQKLFLIQIPIQRNFTQRFKERTALDVDITKEVRVAIRRPDPNRHQLRPLGLPSGVRIYGMTFRRSPMAMTVTGRERDQVFVAPDTPEYGVSLDRVSRGNFQVEADVTGPYGEVLHFESEWQTLTAGQPNVSFSLPLPVEKHGCYAAKINLVSGTPERKRVALTHNTTFALLPKIDRPYRDENPFGTWDFWGQFYTPNNPDLMGPAYVKMGLRYSMISDPEIRSRYGLISGVEPPVVSRGGSRLAKLIEAYKELGEDAYPDFASLYRETALSDGHTARIPDMFTDAKPYSFDETEQKTFDMLWTNAMDVSAEVRNRFSKTKISFDNGNPQLLEEFVRRGFPKDFFGARGNTAGCFSRPPETQPLNWMSSNAGLFMDRMILDHYGYTNTLVRQNFSGICVGTNPGNVSLGTQANYFIRHAVHSLVWKIPRIGIGLLTDVGSSYYHSNCGASGFMFARPNPSPKPSYVAMATLTQELDGAVLSRVIEVPAAPSVYMVEFSRKAGGFVSVAWTPRGQRPIQIAADGVKDLAITDRMGNRQALQAENGKYNLELSKEPVFLRSSSPFGDITVGNPVHDDVPLLTASTRLISDLADLSTWQIDESPNVQLEIYNHKEPRRQGRFNYQAVEDDTKKVLEITPQFPVEGSHWLRAYSVLRHKEGLEIEGEPTEIALFVKGNSGFGRVIFELSDASGQKWISIGAARKQDKPHHWIQERLGEEEANKIEGGYQSDWNTNDIDGRSFISFEGWRLMAFPLPGNYPGEGYHWPYSSQWFYDGDGIVHYPLKVKALIFTAPENVLKFTRYAPPADYAFRVRDLCVGYRPVTEIGPE